MFLWGFLTGILLASAVWLIRTRTATGAPHTAAELDARDAEWRAIYDTLVGQITTLTTRDAEWQAIYDALVAQITGAHNELHALQQTLATERAQHAAALARLQTDLTECRAQLDASAERAARKTEQTERIREMLAQGASYGQIGREVFGYVGGHGRRTIAEVEAAYQLVCPESIPTAYATTPDA